MSNVNIYNLNTVGTSCMVTRNGQCQAQASANQAAFVDNIALFRAK